MCYSVVSYHPVVVSYHIVVAHIIVVSHTSEGVLYLDIYFSFLTALKMAAGGGLGGGGGNPIWSFVWFLALLFVAFPVAGFCAGWYILILPFSVCVEGLTVIRKTF